ncbi:hypothetical protein H9X57_02625 [Flavobacterium piscinae]|uniref:hypothetical protein n=1 Tax=Flavobacterium piscinae TaxID=2506424 RepID=UPI0019C52DBB|nr:hypothetical protein [Flavobacterium piscinae]MBC8882686.1 hypothetical protein [Flavobacterium piscinae]
MKKILFFLLFINFSFSQNEKLTITKIDSICEANGIYGISEGHIKINKKKKKKLIGSGRFSIKTYLNYYNQEYYNNLSLEEKKGTMEKKTPN